MYKGRLSVRGKEMDCNRDEAVRAKVLAEQKLASQEYALAKKYALKAQQLFPGLENMPQIMAVVDVHMAALVKIGASNEMDWYGILQVEPTAEEIAVKKQYRKLALLLHPDKNRLAGAESAFKLIGEASQVLSDKTRRLAYNAKRGLVRPRTKHKPPARNQRGSNANKHYPEQNGHSAPSTNAQSFAAARAQPQLHPFTFWTACPFCQMRYQYLRKFENQNLLCPHCRKPFLARDLSRGYPPQAPFTQTRVYPAQDPFLQTGQFKPNDGTEGLNCFANGNQSFPNATTPMYKTAADFTQRPNETKSADDMVQKEARRKGSEFASSKVPERGTDLPQEIKVTEKTDVKTSVLGNVEGIQKLMEQVAKQKEEQMAKQKEETERTKAFDSDAVSKNRTDAAESVKLDKQPSSKSGGIRRFLERQKDLAQRKEQQKNTTPIGKNLEESVPEKKMEGHAGFTENIKIESTEKGSSRRKRKRGKKHGQSSSSETEEDAYWGKMSTAWKREGHPRRSSRARGNVTYNCNGSDDDFQDAPLRKKTKGEGDVRLPQHATKNSDMAKNLANLGKSTIQTKLNLHRMAAAPMVNEAKLDDITCPEGGKSPCNPESKTACSNSVDGGSVPSRDVPDAEFHNFNKGREAKDVEVGQVWALYDDEAGMPKYYMKVKQVRSRVPCEVLVGWFEMRKPSEEIRELLDLGFTFTCGEFIMSSSQIINNVNSFSHLVTWEKAGKGIIRTYPKKGQVWCLYEDWKCGQQLFSSNNVPSKYCMGIVLFDCHESTGVTVRLLKKVPGFKRVFQSSDDQIIQVPFLEVLRFSHQVPAYKLMGNEAPNLPRDCWELDSDAIPSSLTCTDATPSPHT